MLMAAVNKLRQAHKNGRFVSLPNSLERAFNLL